MKITTKEIIAYLKNLKLDNYGTGWVELDNLDEAKLVDYYGEVMVENEHGTIYDLKDLSKEELQAFWRDN